MSRLEESNKMSRVTHVRWTAGDYDKARRMYEQTSDQVRTFSQFLRIMVLTGHIIKVVPFTEPAKITCAVNRVGRNIDDLLKLAREYGIEPGEIKELADQMQGLNQRLDRWWDDYDKARDGRA